MNNADLPISLVPIPELAICQLIFEKKIRDVQDKPGFVPNVFLVLAHRPDEFQAFFAYHDALMLKESTNRSKADREIIVKATSAKNNCFYCVVTHGVLPRIYGKNSITADQVAMNHHKADITSRQKAMLDYAIKVYLDSYPSWMLITLYCVCKALMTRISGILQRLRHFSDCRVEWRM